MTSGAKKKKMAKRTSRRAIANSVGGDASGHDSQGGQSSSHANVASAEEENGAITYTANLLGNRPRIMDVCIPKVLEDGSISAEWRRTPEGGNGEASEQTNSNSSSSNRMLNRFKTIQQRMEGIENGDNHVGENGEAAAAAAAVDDHGLSILQNRPPWWNMELGAFVLNFGGRVSVASVKNFQLCERTNQDYIMLQFGRIQGRHAFTMDFQYPLTPIQAFAIAISSLQSKISFG